MNPNLLNFIKVTTKKEPLLDTAMQDLWQSWYVGKNSWYNYRVLMPNKKYKDFRRLSLNMPAKVCRDWASLLMNEKTDISLQNEKQNKILNDILKKENFISKYQEMIEREFAIGSYAVVVGSKKIDGKDEPIISYVDGTRIAVLSQENGDVTEAAFVKSTYLDGKKYTIISIHQDGEIRNYVFDKDDKLVSDNIVEEKFNITPIQKTQRQMFRFIKPAGSRIEDWTTPFGQSIFASGIDAVKLIDQAYDSFVNEFVLGKKRIFIKTSLLQYKDSDGKKRPVFDSNEVVFNVIQEMGDDAKEMIKEVNMDIRAEQHEAGIQEGLNILSSQCGLGNNFYSFDKNGQAVTATQIISSNSDLFRNIKKQENVINADLRKIITTLLSVKDINVDESDITINFNDSIMVDDETERENMRRDVQDGITPKWEYRVRFYGESEEEAKLKVSQVEPVVDLNTLGIE